MQTNRLQTAPKEEEPTGNIVVMAIGCKECPSNQEYRAYGYDETEAASENVGKVIECVRCHSKWMLDRILVRATIKAADPVTEEWRVAPRFIPILSTFSIDKLNIIDVPVATIEDEKEE